MTTSTAIGSNLAASGIPYSTFKTRSKKDRIDKVHIDKELKAVVDNDFDEEDERASDINEKSFKIDPVEQKLAVKK